MAFIFYVTYQADKYRPIDYTRPDNGIFHNYERDVLDAFESGRRLPESVKRKLELR